MMAKRRTKKANTKRLFSVKVRNRFIDEFIDGMIAQEQDDTGKRYNDVADRVAKRWLKKFEKMSDVMLVKLAFREWEELAEAHFGSKAEWIGI